MADRSGACNTASVLTATDDPTEIEMITADHASSTPCPVAPLAFEAMTLLHRQRLYEERSPELYRAAVERLEKVEAAAAAGHAVSRAGVFFQTCIAMAALDWWDDFEPAEIEAQQAMKRRAQAALESVALAAFTPDLLTLAAFYLPYVVLEAAA